MLRRGSVRLTLLGYNNHKRATSYIKSTFIANYALLNHFIPSNQYNLGTDTHPIMPPKGHKQLKTVCTCFTHNCGTFRHLDNKGNLQPGVELTLNTVKSHRLDDEKANLAHADIPTHLDNNSIDLAEELTSLTLHSSPPPPTSSKHIGSTAFSPSLQGNSLESKHVSEKEPDTCNQQPASSRPVKHDNVVDCSELK